MILRAIAVKLVSLGLFILFYYFFGFCFVFMLLCICVNVPRRVKNACNIIIQEIV